MNTFTYDMLLSRFRPLLICLGACLFLGLGIQPLSAQLTADFSAIPQDGCNIVVAAFQDLSTGNPVSWEWTFTRNGQVVGTINGQNPGRIFTSPGCYDVQLVVTDINGATDTLSRPCYIEVFANPQPSFTSNVSSGCSPLTVNFTNTTVINAASITTSTWVFRNRATGVSLSSGQIDPTVTFTEPGRYDIQLRIINSNGCDTIITVFDYLSVSNSPIADFTLQGTSGCILPVNVIINNTSQANGATNIIYEWDFPGGAPASSIGPTPPTIQYNAAGAYQATLIATAGSGCADTSVANFNVTSGRPTAGFTVSDPTPCVGVAATFIDTTTIGVGGTSQWDFGDNNTGTGRVVSHSYASPGVYQVRLIASSGQGCSDTAFTTVTVLGNPTASFTFTPANSCDPNQVFSLTDQSVVNIVGWNWDFGDGNTSNLQNPTHSYGASGSYQVCLTATDNNGCQDRFCSPNNAIINEPNAAFSANVTRACAPYNTVLTSSSTSTDPIVGYEWTLGDGSGIRVSPGTATGPTVNATVNIQGDYTIRLVITTASGCTDTLIRTNYLQGGNTPTFNFTVSEDSACVAELITFTAAPSDPSWDYTWNFGYPSSAWITDDAIITQAFADTGCYDVALVVENRGCEDTVIIRDAVCVFPPRADFSLSDTAICSLPATINITDNSLGPISTYEWFLNGVFVSNLPTLPSVTLPPILPPGIYTVSLVVTHAPSGCTDTASVNVAVGNPIADFNIDQNIGCKDFTVQFGNNTFNGSVERWFFGDGTTNNQNVNPSHTYRDTGLFDVTLIAIDRLSGCRDTLTVPDAVRVNGIGIDFTAVPDKGCVPLDVQFNSTSQAAFGATITSLNWNFGDPNNPTGSTLPNPTHTYTAAGFYNVTLRATDSNGCRDSVTIPAVVQATQPVASFIFDKDTTCLGDVVRFIDQSVGDGLSYQWQFSPLPTDTSSQQNPLWIPSMAGDQTVQLIVEDSIGCSDTTTLVDAIYIDTISVDFTGTPRQGTCPPHAVRFTNLSTGDIGQVIWDFGDGTISFEENPQHIYTTAGCFDVKLTVFHVNGCVDSLIRPCFIDIVGPRAQIDILTPIVCLGETGVVRVITDSVATVVFDPDDIPLQVDASPTNRSDTVIFTHLYNFPGSYDPIVLVADQRGCQVPLPSRIPIRVIQPPQATIIANPDAGCAPHTTQLTDASILGDTAVAQWQWDFGDGNSDTVANPLHTFQLPGSYTVFLKVTDGFGCTDSTTTDIFVTDAPEANFVASDTFNCAPVEVAFTDLSVGFGVVDWIWDFGDGTVLQGVQNPVHTYNPFGLFDVQLVIFDRNGCTDTIIRQDYINVRQPVAYLYAGNPNACSPIQMTFYSDSTRVLSDTTIVSYTWIHETTSGDRIRFTSEDSITQLYTQAGTYDVTLIVEDILGCRDTVFRPDYVNLQPTLSPGLIDIQYASVLGLDSTEVVFNRFNDAAQFKQYVLYWETPNNSGTYRPAEVITDINQTRFVHRDIRPVTERRAHRYKVVVENICNERGDVDATRAHRTVKLDVSPMLDTLRLDWNAYEGWEPQAYEINLPNNYDTVIATIDTVPGNQLFYIDGENTFCYESVSYRVRALRTIGGTISSFSNIDSMFPEHNAPEEPVHIEVASVFEDSVIDVSWLPYQGYSPSIYVISRSDAEGTGFNRLDTLPATQFTYRNSDVAVDDQFYSYLVRMTDTCGDRTPVGRFGRSILLKVEPEGQFPELSWTPYEEWPNEVLTYNIEVFDKDLNNFVFVDDVGKDITRYIDEKTFIRDGEYCYRIRAVEANGVNSSYSNEDCIIFGPKFFTPNAFTPNDDGINDRFFVVAPGVREMTLEIFDRWGNMIFQTTDLAGGWDGTYKGRTAPEGVYIFQLSGSATNGSSISTTGTVTLIR
jgi:gliding motility-associated-like protein